MARQSNAASTHDARRRFRPSSRSLADYAGMVAAMLAGMVVLGLVRDGVAPGPVLREDFETMIMATEMVIGMGAWMIARRHAWRGIAIMSGVMYLPFLVLTPLFWIGAISGGVLLTGGHLLMLPAMALAMPLTHRNPQRSRAADDNSSFHGHTSAEL